jgi:hypothetical protein
VLPGAMKCCPGTTVKVKLVGVTALTVTAFVCPTA